MTIKITKLDGVAGMFMNDIEAEGTTCAPNVGYLLHLMVEAGEIEHDTDIEFPIVTFVTNEYRVFSFLFHGAVFVFKVELQE